MKKRIIGTIAAGLCIVSFTLGTVADEVIKTIKAELRPDFVVEIDDKVETFKNAQGDIVYPILYDGTTYLPIRAIGELMGKTVYWYEDEKRIELKDEKTTVTDADVIITGGSEDVKDKDNSKHHKDIPKVKPDKEKTNNDKINDEALITEEEAKEIAIRKSGLKLSDIDFIEVELDLDNGIYEYSVEIKAGLKEYSADINAKDGKILTWEEDIDD